MNAFDSAWNYVWSKHFCPTTSLFYDYLADGVDLTASLPTPEEIAMQFPNPCGWGTGMEDSMMSAGSMLDVLISRFENEHDPAFAEMAHTVFGGMKLCVESSRSPGFLPRSVSPVDGTSHYINSSRDQYTHFIYSARRFYYSAIASDDEKRDIEKFLAAFADRCIRSVTPENDFDLLREDDRPGQVTRMWGELGLHEVMRLPMFLLAAWDVTRDEKYLTAYRQRIGEALAQNRKWNGVDREWFAFEILQMQYSLRLVWEADPDPAVKAAVLEVMRLAADHSEKYVLEVQEQLHQGRLKPDAVNPDWRKRSFYLSGGGLCNGYGYFVPRHDEIYSSCCFEPLRAAGQGIIIQKLCPERTVPQQQFDALEEITASIDFDRTSSYAPILLVGARFM